MREKVSGTRGSEDSRDGDEPRLDPEMRGRRTGQGSRGQPEALRRAKAHRLGRVATYRESVQLGSSVVPAVHADADGSGRPRAIAGNFERCQPVVERARQADSQRALPSSRDGRDTDEDPSRRSDRAGRGGRKDKLSATSDTSQRWNGWRTHSACLRRICSASVRTASSGCMLLASRAETSERGVVSSSSGGQSTSALLGAGSR